VDLLYCAHCDAPVWHLPDGAGWASYADSPNELRCPANLRRVHELVRSTTMDDVIRELAFIISEEQP